MRPVAGPTQEPGPRGARNDPTCDTRPCSESIATYLRARRLAALRMDDANVAIPAPFAGAGDARHHLAALLPLCDQFYFAVYALATLCAHSSGSVASLTRQRRRTIPSYPTPHVTTIPFVALVMRRMAVGPLRRRCAAGRLPSPRARGVDPRPAEQRARGVVETSPSSPAVRFASLRSYCSSSATTPRREVPPCCRAYDPRDHCSRLTRSGRG